MNWVPRSWVPRVSDAGLQSATFGHGALSISRTLPSFAAKVSTASLYVLSKTCVKKQDSLRAIPSHSDSQKMLALWLLVWILVGFVLWSMTVSLALQTVPDELARATIVWGG